MISQTTIYAKIGMALISAQRVEAISKDVAQHLSEFDETVYGITSSEFLNNSKKSKKARRMLGEVFSHLKLNPKLVLEDELNAYLKKRNLLVHNFGIEYLNGDSPEKRLAAIDFCNDFGRHSEKVESFFKGFIFFLALRHVKDSTELDSTIKILENDFDYFISSLNERNLKDKLLPK